MKMLRITHLSAERRDEWNEFVLREPMFALMQSWEWGEFKEKLGWKASRVAVEARGRILAGAQILIKPLPLGLASITYVPRGPIGKWLDKEITDVLLLELHRIARLNNAIFLKIEPPLPNDPEIDRALVRKGFKAGQHNNQPRTSIVLDLTPDLEVILRRIRSNTRTYIRSAVRNGVTVRFGGDEDLPAFYRMMKATAQREKFSSRTFDYYEKEWLTFKRDDRAAMFLAYHQESLLAVRMAYRFGKYAADFHAGSLKLPSNTRPNNLLVWEAIKWAKDQGCETYDLWGIPDEVGRIVSGGDLPPAYDRTDGLWGVYQFKSAFSKNIIYYVGAYDYVYRPSLYDLAANKYVNSDTVERFSSWLDAFRSRSIS